MRPRRWPRPAATHALGGAGLRRPGLERRATRDRPGRRAARGAGRLRPQGEHRPPARGARRAGTRAPAHRRRADGAGARRARRRLLARARAIRRASHGPVRLAQAAIADGRPLLGICLGHQIVGRAAGASTRRLRFGHHGANHPVKDHDSGRVQVTAQNHEVEVVGETLPPRVGFIVSQRNLNDGSVEGLRHADQADRDSPVPPRRLARPARRARGL